MMAQESKQDEQRLSENVPFKSYSNDQYGPSMGSSSSFNTTDPEQGLDQSMHSSLLTNGLLYDRSEIVLSYPEKVTPIKEPVLSLPIEQDEERIMQADWGNESDDDDNSIALKPNKRLSTAEREEIENQDMQSKGIWTIHAAENGMPYYYNTMTHQSAWEIPQTTNLSSAVATGIPTATKEIESPESAKLDTQQSKKPAANAQTTKTYTAKNTVEIIAEIQKKFDIPASANINRAINKPLPGTTDVKTTNTAPNVRHKCHRSRSRSPKKETSRDERLSRWEAPYSSSRSAPATRCPRPRSVLLPPQPPPAPRDYYYYDDYRYYRRSPSPPPPRPIPFPYRHYPPYDRYNNYSLYDNRYADVGRYSPPPPDIRYRYYDRSPPPLSPPPYHRPRVRNWNRYESYRPQYQR
ncbi:hypothetical protein [Parasitella parasitica]|uniref:WW domain-containing protein n=1 Tax=Parasitella parasitica TaxID=35722 RepID=A0A0B7N150_9FUNG|nr:hypothetical protein [Parasitella parasitica]